MLELELATEVARITLLPPAEFERALQGLQDSPALVRVLADVLSSPLRDEQKQLAAVGINRTVRYRIHHLPAEGPALWQDFLDHVLRHRDMDRVQWGHLLVTGKALEGLLEELEEELCAIVNPLFAALPLKAKALLYDSFLYVETTEATRYIFLRETVENLLAATLEFVAAHHDAHARTPDRDAARLEAALLSSLGGLLGKFAGYSEGPIYELTVKLSLSTDLFLLVVEELLFDPANPQHRSVLRQEFAPDRMGELVLVCGEDEANGLKAGALTIYNLLLGQYDLKAGLEEFDQLQLLFFMENLTPLAVEALVALAGREEGESEEELVVALLGFLNRSCRFNFMLQTFEGLFERIFYELCLPLLQTSPGERALFAAHDPEFIRLAEELCEAHEEQAPTVKNAAGNFLEQLSQALHGSLLFIVENSVQTLRGLLLGEDSAQVEEAVQRHGYRPSADAALQLLALFSSHYLPRQDLYALLRERLLSVEALVGLRGLEKARLLIFLAYNYESLFREQPQEGSRFLLLAEAALEEEGCVAESALLLFENCLRVGFGDEIWQSFVARLASTRLAGVFRLIRQILLKMLDSLPVQKAEELITQVIARLVAEFRCGEAQAGPQGQVRGSEHLFLCLDIIATIAENEQYLKEEPSVARRLWPVFDLFEFADRIEFEDDILRIFNRVLAVERQVTHEHFRFVPHFAKVYEKQNGFGELLQTVTLLLTRGREHLLAEAEGRDDLQRLAEFVKCSYGVMKSEDTLKHVLVFYHYLYLEFAALLPLDHALLDSLLELYRDQKDALRPETRAAIANFLLVAHCRYGCCELGPLGENGIEIFQGHQAKALAVGLRLAIEKDYEGELLLAHLRCSIRLLHFLRHLILSQQPERHGYFQPAFPELAAVDPFSEICLALNFVKRTLEPRRYDAILEELNSEVSLGEIKDLLSRRIVEKSMRTIKRIRQP